MSDRDRFIEDLERTVRTQLRSQKVGYLFGAGASYLNGGGYPLANSLWDRIKSEIPDKERDEIQSKLDMAGTEGIEHALDLLDPGGPEPTSHRTLVTEAIADCFAEIQPGIDKHCDFIKRVSRRSDNFVPMFTLNYDPLIEFASDKEKISVVDGFSGFYKSVFDPNNFDLVPSRPSQARKGRVLRGINGVLHLYKLHGSMGWFSNQSSQFRLTPNSPKKSGWQRLMIPPQYRKASETTMQPYSALWTRYRAWLVHGPKQLNRLVCLGYGMRDQHVNDVIENATARSDFTLLICTKSLVDEVFNHWATKVNVIVVTEMRCSVYGKIGPGHHSLWDFSTLSGEV